MKYLLDTQIFIWIDRDPDKMPAQIRDIISRNIDQIYISYASIWEIEIKVKIGKLSFQSSIEIILQSQVSTNLLKVLPITLEHIYGIKNLPVAHNDPFDRLIISQAIFEDMILLSTDSIFDQYPVTVINT